MFNLPCESLRQFGCSVQPDLVVAFQKFDALILFPDNQL
jgi:hypothetical protein